ncbi:MAG: transporter associated domain-containing protein, partial [Acetobacteraceae bacterium]
VFSGWRFEVLEMDGRRVVRVRVSRDDAPPPGATQHAGI